MAKYVLVTATTAISGKFIASFNSFSYSNNCILVYYGYKYFEIFKEQLQDFLATIKNTERTLSELEKRVEVLENSLTNSNSTNGYDDSFSFITTEENNEKPSANNNNKNEKKIIPADPYVVDVLKVIKNVRKEGADLEERVRYYRGSAGDRVFKQFNEKIIRLLISLDRVDVKGFARLKEEKKDAIAYLKEIQAVLKAR